MSARLRCDSPSIVESSLPARLIPGRDLFYEMHALLCHSVIPIDQELGPYISNVQDVED